MLEESFGGGWVLVCPPVFKTVRGAFCAGWVRSPRAPAKDSLRRKSASAESFLKGVKLRSDLRQSAVNLRNPA